MMERKNEFIQYLTHRREPPLLRRSANSYVHYLSRVSKILGIMIGASTVSCPEDVADIKARLLTTGTNPKTALNYGSALAAYREFVNEEYTSADEIAETSTLVEGAKRRVTVNAYERDPEARRMCIKRHGWNCAVCEMNFAETYGEIGTAYIHVHHKTPLNTLGKDYAVDPEKDLIPVCPNCHAMLHRRRKVLSIEELRAYYQHKKETQQIGALRG